MVRITPSAAAGRLTTVRPFRAPCPCRWARRGCAAPGGLPLTASGALRASDVGLRGIILPGIGAVSSTVRTDSMVVAMAT